MTITTEIWGWAEHSKLYLSWSVLVKLGDGQNILNPLSCFTQMTKTWTVSTQKLSLLPIHKWCSRDGDLSCSRGFKAHTWLDLWFTSGLTCMRTRIGQNIKTTSRCQSSKTDALGLHPQNPYLKYMPRGSNLCQSFNRSQVSTHSPTFD